MPERLSDERLEILSRCPFCPGRGNPEGACACCSIARELLLARRVVEAARNWHTGGADNAHCATCAALDAYDAGNRQEES